MKKLVNLFLALTLVLSLLAVPALADEATVEDESSITAEETATTAEDTSTVTEPAAAEEATAAEEPAAAGDSAKAAGPVTLSVSADKTKAQPGEKVTYTISVSNAQDSGIAGLDFNVNIPEGLEYDSHEVKCSNKFTVAGYNAAAALFQGTGTATIDGINDASWTVMTLTCKVKTTAAAGTAYTLSLTVNDLYDGSMADITSNPTSAEVEIPCTHAQTEVKNAVTATCTTAGYTGDTVCKICGATVKTGSAIAKVDHQWDAGEVTTPATCEEDGVKTVTCKLCGTKETQTVPAKGHKWDAGKETTPATCEEDGVKTFTCETCSETKTEKIPAKGHEWEIVDIITEATCTEDGLQAVHCNVCNKDEEQVIPAGHKWDEGKVTKQATATAKGEKTYTCTVCGETKTEEIPATGTSGSSGSKGKTSPQTGDESNIILWISMMVLCGAGAAVITKKKITGR